MIKLFKHLFKPMQNEDPTLNEKSIGVYKVGRIGAWMTLIVGTVLAFLLATWAGNVIQTIIGIFAEAFTMHFTYILPMISKLFSWEAVFHNEYLLDAIFKYHGAMIASWARGLGFIAIEGLFVIKKFLGIFVKYRNLNHHEYGADRIATPEEIASETNRIPDRGYRYDIPAGVIMMHKMNLRGMINKVVKQQLFSLKNYFQLDSDHDPSGKQFTRFYNTVKVITLFILALLILGGIGGFFEYNLGNGHAGMFLPFYLWLFLWRVLHFVVLGIFDLFVEAFKAELQMLTTLPIYFSVLIGLSEALFLAYIAYYIVDHVYRSAEYDTIHSYLQTTKQNPIGHYFHNVYKHQKQDIHHYRIEWEKFKNPAIIDKESTKSHSKSHQIPIMKHKHPRMYLLKLWLSPVGRMMIHGKHPFLKQPRKALWMAFLQFLNNVLPLDSGITGWYYLTGGNGAMQNVLIYGITRSGKGQMIINTIVDINSRCSHRYQKNMIFNDSKGELAASTYRILKKRGYDVKVLNIMDMSHSMSYNPLDLVIKQAKAGAIGAAATACSELSYTIYNPKGQGQNSYFYTSAASLFDSIAFAQLALAHSRFYGLDDFKCDSNKRQIHDDGKAVGHKLNDDDKYYIDKNDVVHSKVNAWSRITINNILQMTIQLGGENAQLGNDQLSTANQLIIYFQHLQERLNKLRDRKNSNPASMNEVWDDQLTLLNQAVLEFQNSKMAGGKTAGSIYSTFLDRLRIYQQPEVSKMTSMNNYNAEEMGFDRLFTIQFSRHLRLQNVTAKLYGEKAVKKRDSKGNVIYDKDNKPVTESKIDKNNVLEVNKSHLNGIGLAQIPFEKPINYLTFYVEVIIHDERVNHNFVFWIKCHKHYYQPKEYLRIKSDYHIAPKVADLMIINRHKKDEMVIDKYTHKKALKKIELKVIKYPSSKEYNLKPSELNGLAGVPQRAVRQMNFLYNPRPTALFLVTPPNATELNQLCTFLINQTFNTLSNLSLRIAKGRHIQRPLQFILDELGNIPAIPNLSKKVSIGLSQHIEFMLVFQNFEQAVKNYQKDEAHSILSNCSTTYYILSKSAQTIKQVSDAFGTRTIQSTGLNQDPTKIMSANYNHSLMSQKVMPTGVLRHMKPGQIAILRTNDRSTVTGKETKPWPIFDTGKYILPYSFWFLKKYESSDSLNSLPVVTPHKYLNLEDVTVQFNKIYAQMECQHCLDGAFAKSYVGDTNSEIDQCTLGQDFKNNFTSLMNAAVVKGVSPTKTLQRARFVRQLIKRYQPLAQGRDIGQICQYVLATITQGDKKIDAFSTLHDVNPVHQGYNIFNFVMHQYNDVIQYYGNIKDVLESRLSSIDEVKKLKPVLYEPQNIQIRYALREFIENNARGNEDTGDKGMQESNESWLLSQINLVFNNYLDKIGLIHIFEDGHNQLTKMGKSIVNNASYMIKTFFKDNQFTYTPDKPLPSILIPMLNNLKWVEKHPEFNHYYGLIFAQGIISYTNYQDFCNYTDVKGQARTLALSPMSYTSCLMTLFDAFFLHPRLSHEKNSVFHMSPAGLTCLKQFGQLDDTAKDIVSNPDDESDETQEANSNAED